MNTKSTFGNNLVCLSTFSRTRNNRNRSSRRRSRELEPNNAAGVSRHAEGLEGDAWDDWLLWVLQMFWDAICNLQDEVEKIWTAIAPEQLLSKIKQVDGSGSDLDADTLDGKHASELETAVLSQCKICIQRSYGGGDSGQGALPEFPSALAPSGMECYSIDEWSDWIVDDTDGRAGGMATKIKIDCTPPYGD